MDAYPREILDTYVGAIRGNMLTYSIWAASTPWSSAGSTATSSPRPAGRRRIFVSMCMSVPCVDTRDWASVGKPLWSQGPGPGYTALRTPDDLLVVSAGGPAGGFGAIIPRGWGRSPWPSRCALRSSHDAPSLDPRVDPDLEPLGPRTGRRAGRGDDRLARQREDRHRVLLHHLEDLLRKHGVREFIRRRKPDTSRPVPPEMLAELAVADAIVSGIGD